MNARLHLPGVQTMERIAEIGQEDLLNMMAKSLPHFSLVSQVTAAFAYVRSREADTSVA